MKRKLIDKMTKIRWCTGVRVNICSNIHGLYAATGNNDRYDTDGVSTVWTDICYDIHGLYTGKMAGEKQMMYPESG